MKKLTLFTVVLLTALLNLMPALAAEPGVLVAQVKGKAVFVGKDQKPVTLKTAQMIVPPVELTLNQGTTVSLVYTGDGHQELLAGPCKVRISGAGASNLGSTGSIKKVAAPSRKGLAINGKNLNRVGGAANRGQGDEVDGVSVPDVPVRNLSYALDGKMLKVNFEVKEGGSYTVRYGMPTQANFAFESFAETTVAAQGNDWSAVTASFDISGEPDVVGQELGIEIGWKDQRQEYPLQLLDSDQRASLEQLVERALETPDPLARWVLVMAIYDEYDQVDEALNAGLKAVEQAPEDAHLRVQVARLSLGRGHYEQAKRHLEKASELKG